MTAIIIANVFSAISDKKFCIKSSLTVPGDYKNLNLTTPVFIKQSAIPYIPVIEKIVHVFHEILEVIYAAFINKIP